MAVELCISGKPTSEVAEELGLSSKQVSRWKRDYQKRKDGSFSGHGKPSLTAEQVEITKLKKQLRESEIELDILKKAAPRRVSIFSRNDSIHCGSKSFNL